ncbi:hypothetical protein WJX73_008863 [Symbiochloris irregularis]|uniref:Uncharacterized protein n=1 Tax=Symbiochloris irregularis TaxID=706552 RepID=A0AAW1NQ51_9CHLO
MPAPIAHPSPAATPRPNCVFYFISSPVEGVMHHLGPPPDRRTSFHAVSPGIASTDIPCSPLKSERMPTTSHRPDAPRLVAPLKTNPQPEPLTNLAIFTSHHRLPDPSAITTRTHLPDPSPHPPRLPQEAHHPAPNPTTVPGWLCQPSLRQRKFHYRT